MARKRWWHGAMALLALSGAGGVAASGGASALAASAVASWSPDPDDQFLLDVNIRQLTPGRRRARLSDPRRHLRRVRRLPQHARRADEDRPRGEDGQRLGVQGRQSDHHRPRRGEVAFGGKREPLAPETVRETPEGWCVDSKALGRWFGIGVEPIPRARCCGSNPKTKLPVELAIERRQRAAADQAGAVRPRRAAAGPPALSHVAHPGARLRRQRRRHLSAPQRRQGRPPGLGLCGGRNCA